MVCLKALQDSADSANVAIYPLDALEASILRAQMVRKSRYGEPAVQSQHAAQRLLGVQSIVRRLASKQPEMPKAGLTARLDGMDTKATRLDQVCAGIFNNPVDADILSGKIAELRQVTQNEIDFRQSLWSLLRTENIPAQARPIIMRRGVQWFAARVMAKNPRNTDTRL